MVLGRERGREVSRGGEREGNYYIRTQNGLN